MEKGVTFVMQGWLNKEWLSLKKKIQNQDEEKKGKNIGGEVERQRDERCFVLI